MIPSVTFLFGCWVGCFLGLFLAGALSASREVEQEETATAYSARTSAGTLAIMEKTKA